MSFVPWRYNTKIVHGRKRFFPGWRQRHSLRWVQSSQPSSGGKRTTDYNKVKICNGIKQLGRCLIGKLLPISFSEQARKED